MARVLIVDDCEDNVRLLIHGLTQRGHDVVVAFDGWRALEVAKVERPDCILLDVNMPGMDGYEVCRRLKSIAELRFTPVIMVSACDDDDDVVLGLEAGADDYVTKPFNTKVLEARVRSSVRVKRAYDIIHARNRRLNGARQLATRTDTSSQAIIERLNQTPASDRPFRPCS